MWDDLREKQGLSYKYIGAQERDIAYKEVLVLWRGKSLCVSRAKLLLKMQVRISFFVNPFSQWQRTLAPKYGQGIDRNGSRVGLLTYNPKYLKLGLARCVKKNKFITKSFLLVLNHLFFFEWNCIFIQSDCHYRRKCMDSLVIWPYRYHLFAQGSTPLASVDVDFKTTKINSKNNY